MLRFFLLVLFSVPLSFAGAQVLPSKAIQCRSPRTSLFVDLKSCQLTKTVSICKSRIVVDKTKTVDTGLYMLVKQLPQSPSVNLMLTTDDRDKVTVGFSGAYSKGLFLGETHMKIENIKLTENMTCRMF